jgi:hypothetical protein
MARSQKYQDILQPLYQANRSQLLKYCAKDTYALYDLIRILSENP